MVLQLASEASKRSKGTHLMWTNHKLTGVRILLDPLYLNIRGGDQLKEMGV